LNTVLRLSIDWFTPVLQVTTNGKAVIDLTYDKVEDFEHGIAPVYRLVYSGPPGDDYDTLGYIDTKGTQYWEE